MPLHALTFDAVAEPMPGPKWQQRWDRSWPAYRAWFLARGGAGGPSRAEGEAALLRHMPELVPVHRKLAKLAGDDDLQARFLSTWCPPPYLGGCSLAAHAEHGRARLVRNYDLAPDLNEGLLLRSEWTGQPVMGMVEFLWGLSDGINAAGLCVALAFGGRDDVAPGFGITTILRYVLETCRTVDQALDVLTRVPSHMAYNVVLADRQGTTAMIEIHPGGGGKRCTPAIATNHQREAGVRDQALLESSHKRLASLQHLLERGIEPAALDDAFLEKPLFQQGYAKATGTLFTAVYDPMTSGLVLRWPGEDWVQSLDRFTESQRQIIYKEIAKAPAPSTAPTDHGALALVREIRPFLPPKTAKKLEKWGEDAAHGAVDWAALGQIFASSGSSGTAAAAACQRAR